MKGLPFSFPFRRPFPPFVVGGLSGEGGRADGFGLGLKLRLEVVKVGSGGACCFLLFAGGSLLSDSPPPFLDGFPLFGAEAFLL